MTPGEAWAEEQRVAAQQQRSVLPGSAIGSGIGSGHSGIGSGQNRTAMQELVGRLQALFEGASRLAAVAEDMADRAVGPVPAGPDTALKAQCAGSLTDEIAIMVGEIDQQHGRITGALARLGQFV